MPIPNVYTATEDPTSQVGNNGDIYFHTGLIGLSAINVYKKVNGRWGLTGSISTAGNSFSNVYSVGSNGDFHSVQSAINHIQALTPIPNWPIIEIGNNYFNEDLVTTLPRLTIRGAAYSGFLQGIGFIKPFHTLTIPEHDSEGGLLLQNVGWGNSRDGDDNTKVIGPGVGTDLQIYLVNANLATLQNAGSGLGIFGSGIADFCFEIIADTFSAKDIWIGSNYYDSNGNVSAQPGATTIFPDSDPHIAGAGYWTAGVLTKSTG